MDFESIASTIPPLGLKGRDCKDTEIIGINKYGYTFPISLTSESHQR